MGRYAFGWALEEIRKGKKLRRAGWNGSGMFVVLQKGYPNGIPINKNTAEATGLIEGTVCNFLPYLMLKTACPDGTFTFVPWTASQSDILEFDWEYAS